jgi:hypothetical protein
MMTLCIISFFLYAANKYWYFAPNLTPMGLMRNLPYYYIGYVLGQYRLFRSCNRKHDLIACIACLSGSILCFHWHLLAFFDDQHLLHIVLFYPANIGFMFGVLYGCKLLDSWKSSIITNISIGTLVIVGLHVVLVTVANFIIEHLIHTNGTICYHWYNALPTAIMIVAILYPIILWGKKHAPSILGRGGSISA